DLCLKLDGYAKKRFLQGATVSKDVPLTSPGFRSNLEGLESYRDARFEVGYLIRPLFWAPPELPAPLRHFQDVGIRWLVKMQRAILADDMGLGKTIQAALALRSLIFEGVAFTCLVICPKSLIANWQYELNRWAPDLTQMQVTPADRDSRMTSRAGTQRHNSPG